MTIDEIARLIRRLEQSGITELEVSDGLSSLKLRLGPVEAPPRAPGLLAVEARGSGGGRSLRAASIGRLRLSHPEAAPDPPPGFPRSVASGAIVAFLEAGGCLRPILADADCTIGAPLLAEGSLVGYGMPVFPLL